MDSSSEEQSGLKRIKEKEIQKQDQDSQAKGRRKQ